jgi:hypothetical protein
MEDIMRTTGRRQVIAVAAALAVVVGAGFAAAQEPVETFDQLNTRLKVGDTVWVTDAQGREVKGQIRDIQPSSLMLDADGTKTFQASDVRQLVERGVRSTKACVFWGLVGGSGAGVLAALATRGPLSTTWCVGTVPADVACSPTRTGLGDEAWFLVPAGAGVGLAVGAFLASRALGPKNVIYSAPGGQPSARLTLAPIMTRHTKGVRLAISF